MNVSSFLDQEYAFTDRVKAWMDEARAIKAYCEEKERPLPLPLQMLFSESTPALLPPPAPKIQPFEQPKPRLWFNKSTTQEKRLSRREVATYVKPEPPDYGPKPHSVPPDWVPVPLSKATVGNLMLYILSQARSPLTGAELHAELRRFRPNTGQSTLHMTLQTLAEEGSAMRGEDGWRLGRPAGGTLVGDRLWTPLVQARSFDRSSIRSEAVLRVLAVNRSLSVAQITHCLQNVDWLKVPIDSNLIKADLRTLSKEGKVRKEGVEWLLNDEKEATSIEATS